MDWHLGLSQYSHFFTDHSSAKPRTQQSAFCYPEHDALVTRPIHWTRVIRHAGSVVQSKLTNCDSSFRCYTINRKTKNMFRWNTDHDLDFAGKWNRPWTQWSFNQTQYGHSFLLFVSSVPFTLLKHLFLEHAPVVDFQDVFPILFSLQGLYKHWLCCFAALYSGCTLKIGMHSIFARTHWQSHSPHPQHIRVCALYECTWYGYIVQPGASLPGILPVQVHGTWYGSIISTGSNSE